MMVPLPEAPKLQHDFRAEGLKAKTGVAESCRQDAEAGTLMTEFEAAGSLLVLDILPNHFFFCVRISVGIFALPSGWLFFLLLRHFRVIVCAYINVSPIDFLMCLD